MEYENSSWHEDLPDGTPEALADHILDLGNELNGLVRAYEQHGADRYLDRMEKVMELGQAAFEALDYWRKDLDEEIAENLYEIAEEEFPTYEGDFEQEEDRLTLEEDFDLEEAEERADEMEDAVQQFTENQAFTSDDPEVRLAYAEQEYRNALENAEELDAEIEVIWPENLAHAGDEYIG